MAEEHSIVIGVDTKKSEQNVKSLDKAITELSGAILKASDSDRKLAKELTAEQKAAKKATAESRKLAAAERSQAAAAKKAAREADALAKKTALLAKTQKANSLATRGAAKATTLLGAAFTGIAIVAVTKNLLGMNQQLVRMDKRLITITGNANAFDAVAASALKLGVGLDNTTDILSKFAVATSNAFDVDRILSWTEGLTASALLTGESMASMSGAIRQLTQSLSSGVLRGDEFNSVTEQLPLLMIEISRQTGKTIGDLRDFAAEGKITSTIIVAGLDALALKADETLASLPVTFEQSLNRLQTNWALAWKSMLGDESMLALQETATGVINAIANALTGLTQGGQLEAAREALNAVPQRGRGRNRRADVDSNNEDNRANFLEILSGFDTEEGVRTALELAGNTIADLEDRALNAVSGRSRASLNRQLADAKKRSLLLFSALTDITFADDGSDAKRVAAEAKAAGDRDKILASSAKAQAAAVKSASAVTARFRTDTQKLADEQEALADAFAVLNTPVAEQKRILDELTASYDGSAQKITDQKAALTAAQSTIDSYNTSAMSLIIEQQRLAEAFALLNIPASEQERILAQLSESYQTAETAQRSWGDSIVESVDVMEAFANTADRVAQGIAGSLVDMAVTGESSFSRVAIAALQSGAKQLLAASLIAAIRFDFATAGKAAAGAAVLTGLAAGLNASTGSNATPSPRNAPGGTLSRLNSAGSGGSFGDVNVQVNNAPAGTSPQVTRGNDGSIIIDLVAGDIAKGGAIFRALEQTTGARRVPVSR